MRCFSRRLIGCVALIAVLALAVLPWLGATEAQTTHGQTVSPLSLSLTYMGYVYSLTVGISFVVALLIKLLSIVLRSTRALRVIY